MKTLKKHKAPDKTDIPDYWTIILYKCTRCDNGFESNSMWWWKGADKDHPNYKWLPKVRGWLCYRCHPHLTEDYCELLEDFIVRVKAG